MTSGAVNDTVVRSKACTGVQANNLQIREKAVNQEKQSSDTMRRCDGDVRRK